MWATVVLGGATVVAAGDATLGGSSSSDWLAFGLALLNVSQTILLAFLAARRPPSIHEVKAEKESSRDG